MRIVRGSQVGQQAILWVPDAAIPSEGAFRPASTSRLQRKPRRAGLWSSTYTGPETLSGWVQWCRDEEFALGKHRLWLLTPEPDVEVTEIDTFADLRRLHRVYGRSEDNDHWLDFSLMAERFAGVHLTEEGQWATRLSMPYDLYGWDCESTLWLRWAFASVEDGGLVDV